MTKEIKKWWENNSEAFQKDAQVPIGITYGPGMPNESKLKLIGPVKGKNVLEIGCGGAQCGIGFAKKGAKVIGIDISEEQLKYAKELIDKNKVEIKLLRGDITNLKQIKSNSQDIVFSSWALFYVKNLKKCFKEVYRVLKKKGIFVFSTHHPFWWMVDKKSMKIERCYFDRGEHRRSFRKGVFVDYEHAIEDIMNALTNAKFIIERVAEPDPRKKGKHISTEITPEAFKRKAMKKIPRTLIIKARK